MSLLGDTIFAAVRPTPFHLFNRLTYLTVSWVLHPTLPSVLARLGRRDSGPYITCGRCDLKGFTNYQYCCYERSREIISKRIKGYLRRRATTAQSSARDGTNCQIRFLEARVSRARRTNQNPR